MLLETERKLNDAAEEIAVVRRGFAELGLYGWEGDTQCLIRYDAARGELAQLQAEKDSLPVKGNDKRIGVLLDRESLLIETLTKLATESQAALVGEKLAFFAARENMLKPLDDKIEKADAEIRAALVMLSTGLQSRWKEMQASRALRQMLGNISEKYNTTESFGVPENVLPKPFAKKPVNIWPVYISVVLGRVGEVLQNAENVLPSDIADQVFRREG